MWLFAFYISVVIRFILDNKLGELDIPLQEQSVYQNILLLIGMIVLAQYVKRFCSRDLYRRLMKVTAKIWLYHNRGNFWHTIF